MSESKVPAEYNHSWSCSSSYLKEIVDKELLLFIKFATKHENELTLHVSTTMTEIGYLCDKVSGLTKSHNMKQNG